MENNFKKLLILPFATISLVSLLGTKNVHAAELTQISNINDMTQYVSLLENVSVDGTVLGDVSLQQTASESPNLSLTNPETGEELIVGTTYTITKTEYDELCKIIQAEAGNQDEEGKILVGNVILNRVASEKFPNDIHSVIFQKSQFSPIGNGMFKKAVPSEETKAAVNKLLNGEDYSLGALYFRATKSTSNWGKLKLILSHGGHKFYI